MRRHRGGCHAGRCRRLCEIRAHRRVAVLACSLGLAHFEVAWSLLILVLCASITAATRATLAAIAVA